MAAVQEKPSRDVALLRDEALLTWNSSEWNSFGSVRAALSSILAGWEMVVDGERDEPVCGFVFKRDDRWLLMAHPAPAQYDSLARSDSRVATARWWARCDWRRRRSTVGITVSYAVEATSLVDAALVAADLKHGSRLSHVWNQRAVLHALRSEAGRQDRDALVMLNGLAPDPEVTAFLKRAS